MCSATLSVRKREGRRVRLPLAQLTVASPDASALAPFRDLIADEVNVKHVELTDDVAASASAVLQVVPAVAGPRLGSDVQKVIRAVRAGDWTAEGDTVRAGGITLQPGEFVLRLVPANEHATRRSPGTTAWSRSTSSSRPSCRQKDWPATSSASCSRPAAMQGST